MVDDALSMPIILFLGPQGAGKGTQARLLSMLTGWPHIDAGSLLREEAEKDTPLGRRIADRIDQGLLVPDELITQLVLQKIRHHAILDGFPRTLNQYQLYKSHGGRIDQAILITIPDDEAVRRISRRRVCLSPLGEWTFIAGDHTAEIRCKKQGGRIIQRKDDTPTAIRRRLALYHTETEALIRTLEEEQILTRIDGHLPVQEVLRRVIHTVRGLHQALIEDKI